MSSSSVKGENVLTKSTEREYVVVKCSNITAEFYPAKLKKIGKSMAKCIKHCGKWYNPNDFENLAGMQKSKKWKQSITCGEKTLGEWLADGGREETPKETEKCTQQPRNVTPIVLGTSDCTQLSKSNNEEDVDTNPITCQNDSQLENTQVILDVRESIGHGNYGNPPYTFIICY